MMQVINFLPNDYATRQAERQAIHVCVVIAALGLLTIGVAVGLPLMQVSRVSRMRDLVDRQYRSAGRQIEQLKELEKHKEGLLRKVELSATLLERVPRSCVLARLTNALPANTSLQMLTMRTVEVDVRVREPSAEEDKNKQKGSSGRLRRQRNKAKPKTVKVKRIQFRVEGLAPTGAEVAEYIARLNTDPLFEDVDIQFHEEFPYAEGVQVRRFRLAFYLSSKAEEVLASAVPAGPVAAPVPVAAGAAKGAS